MHIGEVAQRTGLTVDAIRFYERAGLLSRPARTLSGYEIRELFSIQRHPEKPCLHVRGLIEQKLSLVRKKITEFRNLETELAAALYQCRRAHKNSCPVLAEIRRKR